MKPVILAALLSLMIFTFVSTNQAQAQARQVPQNQTEVLLSFAPVVKAVAPSVVNIFTKRTVKVRRSPLFDDPMFERFFGRGGGGVPKERVQGSLGSGVIVRREGYIVTNYHVIKDAEVIRVITTDRREFDARVVVKDERTDLAVLKVDIGTTYLPAMTLADSDAIEVGDITLAIGNPFGVGQTVTSGIVSATSRTMGGVNDLSFFIQTDAAINPGNSGGALVGLNGQLMGINTAIYSRTGASNGIGFAIPSNMVKTVIKAAENDGVVLRPWFGVSGQTVDATISSRLGLPRPGGVIVNSIYPNSPAALAGLQDNDVILSIDQKDVVDLQSLQFRIATQEVDAKIIVTVYRDEKYELITVQLTNLPERPRREVTKLSGLHLFQDVTVGNLSPKYADELGLDPMTQGVIVTQVPPRSPAGRRQLLRSGDILLSVNSQKIELVTDLVRVLAEPDNRFDYRFNRDGKLWACSVIGLRSFSCKN
jgi:serine protease Do